MTARELADAILARPVTPERARKALRHITARGEFDAMVATITREDRRVMVQEAMALLVEQKFR